MYETELEMENDFIGWMKNGIYKELHFRGLLTDMQLNQLLNETKTDINIKKKQQAASG